MPPQLTYDKVFRVLIVQFLDPYNFDVRSVKKSCIHIVHPDGRIIPFDTYNLFYRDTAAARMPASPGNEVLPILAGGMDEQAPLAPDCRRCGDEPLRRLGMLALPSA